eukprot:CAMPEP_0181296318 /NCGR_PEP_ID=MMETSP1101-20121128/4638_1 /TAXON_ID=46948 /ORGANISM="Rhodomonas abbreviata, Strain Caron Lab Isolate" /LENGTH=1493 /DNA_ID=CAMNT_0023401171 /DNA_START=129 /DNA_END=4606 /DNA_ORIENTATION=+
MPPTSLLSDEIVQQSARVAFSAYSNTAALTGVNPVDPGSVEGGLPLHSQRRPEIVETSDRIQIVLWQLRDAQGLYVAIGIRGTVEIENMLVDMKCQLVELDIQNQIFASVANLEPHPRVHCGFKEAFLRMRSDIFRILKEQLTETKKRILVSGHSLGGALAVLVGLDLAVNGSQLVTRDQSPQITVVTFGKPHVGDRSFCSFFRNYFRNSTNVHINFSTSADVVPKLAKCANQAYEHEGDSQILDFLPDHAIETIPFALDVALGKEGSVLEEVKKQWTKKIAALILRFHSCKYYWEKLQTYSNPDRRSVLRMNRALVLASEVCKSGLACAQKNPNVVQTLMQILKTLPRSRGCSGLSQMQIAGFFAAGTVVSSGIGYLLGFKQRQEVREALTRLEQGQVAVQTGITDIKEAIAYLDANMIRLHTKIEHLHSNTERFYEDIKKGQDRIEQLISDLPDRFRKALQDMQKEDIRVRCRHMIDLLTSGDVARIQEHKTLVTGCSADQQKLKNHLMRCWDDCQHDPDADMRRDIEAVCQLLLQCLQLELAYRVCLLSNSEGEADVSKEFQRHLKYWLPTYGPVLGRMVWICASHTDSATFLETMSSRFRLICGLGSDSDDSGLEEMDVMVIAKRKDTDDASLVCSFSSDDWFSLLALDHRNNEARAMLAPLQCGPVSDPKCFTWKAAKVALNHFQHVLKCACGTPESDSKIRLAALDGLVSLVSDSERLEQCLQQQLATLDDIVDALLHLSDVLWDADRLVDFLHAMSILFEDRLKSKIPKPFHKFKDQLKSKNSKPFHKFIEKSPQLWRRVSQLIQDNVWIPPVLAAARNLLHVLVQKEDWSFFRPRCNEAEDEEEHDIVMAWQRVTTVAQGIQVLKVDMACLKAIESLDNNTLSTKQAKEKEVRNPDIRYEMRYDEDSDHIVVVFSSASIFEVFRAIDVPSEGTSEKHLKQVGHNREKVEQIKSVPGLDISPADFEPFVPELGLYLMGNHVVEVQDGSASAIAGLKVRDVVKEVNGVSVNAMTTLIHVHQAARAAAAGTGGLMINEIKVRVWRAKGALPENDAYAKPTHLNFTIQIEVSGESNLDDAEHKTQEKTIKPLTSIASLRPVAALKGAEVNARIFSSVEGLDVNTLCRELSFKCNANGTQQFVFTGHSVGGAGAVLARVLIHTNRVTESLTGSVVTFGAPLIFGDGILDYRELLAGSSRCYVNDLDFTPRLFGPVAIEWQELWQHRCQNEIADKASEARMRSEQLSSLYERYLQLESALKEIRTKKDLDNHPKVLVGAAMLGAFGAALATAAQAKNSYDKFDLRSEMGRIKERMEFIMKNRVMGRQALSEEAKMALLCRQASLACQTVDSPSSPRVKESNPSLPTVGDRYVALGLHRFLASDGSGGLTEAQDSMMQHRFCTTDASNRQRPDSEILPEILHSHTIDGYGKRLRSCTSLHPDQSWKTAVVDIAQCLDRHKNLRQKNTLTLAQESMAKEHTDRDRANGNEDVS